MTQQGGRTDVTIRLAHTRDGKWWAHVQAIGSHLYVSMPQDTKAKAVAAGRRWVRDHRDQVTLTGVWHMGKRLDRKAGQWCAAEQSAMKPEEA